MLFNDVRPQLNSSVALTTGGLSLMVGSLLLSLSAFSVYRLNQAQDIYINTTSWNWMSEVHLRLDAGQEALGPQLSEAEIPEHIFVSPKAPLIATVSGHASAKTKAIVQRKSVAHAKTKWIAKAKSILRKAKPPTQEPDTQAMIVAKQVKAKQIIKDELKVAAAAPQSQPDQASAQELNILQGLHHRLSGQFLLAMTTQPQMQNPAAQVQLAQIDAVPAIETAPEAPTVEKAVVENVAEQAAVEVAPESNTFHSLRRKKTHHHKKVIVSEVAEIQSPAPASTSSDEVNTQPVVAQTQDQTVNQAQPQQLDDTFKAQLEDQIHAIQAAPQGDYSSQFTTANTAKAETEATTTEGESGKILVSSGSQTVWVTPSTTQPSTHQGGATLTTHHDVAIADNHNVQSRGEPQDPSANQNPNLVAAMTTHGARHLLNALADVQATPDYSTGSLVSQLPAAHIDGVKFTEAFDWISPVSSGYQAYVSKELGHSTGGWIVSQAQDHWPTLSRRVTAGVPLISRNTSKLLSALSGAALQNEAGIVFGKIPAGWSVRLSGRSERPVFLNERNQTISSSNLEGERYFAFLNAAPGAHLMYLADSAGSEEGAIGIAVIGGVATYADLTQIKKTTFTGRVFDGSDVNSRSLSGVTVRVLGALNTHAETTRSGRFTIENVLTVGDYPVYVETDGTSGYTHRYQFSPNKLKDATLYRLSENAIQTWIMQLEGAISPDSGIVIAAAPGLFKGQSAKAKLAPAVQSLAPNPTLRPEVYTLSSAGQMQVGQALDAQNARFVSVQVPEGPAIARIIDSEKPSDQNLLWSEMIMASPAVVNIVGPF